MTNAIFDAPPTQAAAAARVVVERAPCGDAMLTTYHYEDTDELVVELRAPDGELLDKQSFALADDAAAYVEQLEHNASSALQRR